MFRRDGDMQESCWPILAHPSRVMNELTPGELYKCAFSPSPKAGKTTHPLT